MVRSSRFRALCLALPEVEEHPHFDRAAFRTPARIFTTLSADGSHANVLLPPELQEQLVASQPDVFARVNGAWGARGWTQLHLAEISEAMCRDVLREAHALVASTTKRRPTAKKKSRSQGQAGVNGRSAKRASKKP